VLTASKPVVSDAHFRTEACRLRTHDSEHVAQMGMTGHSRDSAMSNTTDPDQPTIYHIRLKGHLGGQWTDWFGGLSITQEENGETLLSGSVVDQAALHSLLKKVRDLGMPLLSLSRVQTGDAHASDVDQ
jgi:hypothetical protein